MSAGAKQGDTVRVHYEGSLTDGSVFDSSEGQEPLEFVIGSGQVIAGFENMVIGMVEGESRQTTIAPDDAYGPHRPDLMLQIERSKLPPGFQTVMGQRLELSDGQGHTVEASVADISLSHITLDANHALAGKQLVFRIDLVEID